MHPISAESNVRWGFDSLETIRDMAGLRFSEQHFRKSPALTGEAHFRDADESIRNCDAATMLGLSLDYQHRSKNRPVHCNRSAVLMPSVFALVGLMARSKWWGTPPEARLGWARLA